MDTSCSVKTEDTCKCRHVSNVQVCDYHNSTGKPKTPKKILAIILANIVQLKSSNDSIKKKNS